MLTLALATISEAAGLILWLRFAAGYQQVVGIGALLLGQLIERIAVVLIAQEAYAGRPFPRNFYRLVILSGPVESAIWIIWLVIWDSLPVTGLLEPVVPTVALFVMQLYFHSWVMTFSLNKPPFYRYARDPLTIVFSAIEAVAGAAWLMIARTENSVLAAVVLFVGLTIEHVIQGIAIENATRPISLRGPKSPEREG